MTPRDRQRMLAWLAAQFDGVREDASKGPNRGAFVERFQRTIGKAEGEPWCVSFVQYCLAEVDKYAGWPSTATGHRLPKTESSQLLWNGSVEAMKTQAPEVGAVIVWRKAPGVGHAGIVTEVTGDNVMTIEGNTGTGDQREGDGVAFKRRVKGQIPSMQLLGYLRPWGA